MYRIVEIKPVNDETLPKGFVIMRDDDIFNELKKIEDKVLRKFGHVLQRSAMYEYMYDRCMLERRMEKGTVYVMARRYKSMMNKYAKGKVDSPFDLGYDEFNPLIRMFAEGYVSEC
jgi:hypothetical protein